MMYGPAGSGKTCIAQRLGSLLPGAVPVPHAITVAGEIIQVFDPLVHVLPTAKHGWQGARLIVAGRSATNLRCSPATAN
ncbi:ATP-binding protein [Cupriavidus basilensis]